MRRNWLQAYDFASGRGAIFLGEYARARQPFARIGEQTASVQVTSVLRASNRSFQVKWTESEYERGRSEEHTSELQSLMRISYAVFCLKKKNTEKSDSKTHNQ